MSEVQGEGGEALKRLSIGTGALSGALFTAPLLGVIYLADELARLPFLPYDLFDWITRVLPGGVVTFGIDLMIETMLLFGISVADTAKTAEQVLAVLQFFSMGVVGGALFFAFVRLREVRPDLVTGLVVGALAGFPMIAISIAIGGSARRRSRRRGVTAQAAPEASTAGASEPVAGHERRTPLRRRPA